MKKLIAFAFACFSCLAQTPQAPVFNTLSPTVIGVTFGPNASYPHCYFWSVVPAPWRVEGACYVNNKAVPVSASQDSNLGAWWAFPDGIVTWIFKGSADGKIDYQIAAALKDGTGEKMWSGTF